METCLGRSSGYTIFDCKISRCFIYTQDSRSSKKDLHVIDALNDDLFDILEIEDPLFDEVGDCKKRISVLEQDCQNLTKWKKETERKERVRTIWLGGIFVFGWVIAIVTKTY